MSEYPGSNSEFAPGVLSSPISQTSKEPFEMKTSLVAIVLAFAAVAWGQQTTTQPQAQPGAPGQAGQPAQPAAPAQPQQKKEIKDPAEYNAYVGAVQQKDPNAKISGLEAFLTQYPNSVMKEDALEVLMGAYQQASNQAKMLETAQRVLQANPNNLRALALLAYVKRAQAEAGQNAQQNLADAAQYGNKGLEALKTASKPEGMSDADFEKLKTQMGVIFNGAAGIAALQNKDYATAQSDLRNAVQGDPNELRNVYPLALADLTGTPPNPVEGLFFIARAANLAAGSPGQGQIQAYGKSQYTKYHGSDQGWTDLLATAKTTPLPPAGFNITKYVPPTPAEQAADLVKNKTPNDVKQMSFADWELVLSAGKAEDQEKVWSVIKGVPLQMEGLVMAATPTEVQIAESQDDIDAKRADIVLTMSGTIPDRLMPKVGSNLQFEGTPVSYTPSPFVMNMEKGALLTAKKPAPAKKPVHRRPTTSQ
jgi:tetratricopeptide (TPR) repeat protein